VVRIGLASFAWAVLSLESSKVQDSRKPRPQITPESGAKMGRWEGVP
jgi:hypothetical protein